MITHIKTKGFKGFDINEDVFPKTIYYGKNTAGKSARAAAIALTILGFIPFVAKTSKNNAEILNDFGCGDTLTTSVICNEIEFERHFSRSEKGTVSQRLRVDKKKYSAQDFALELYRAGNPKIIDVPDFMSMSDQKKINVLFSLYPPAADLKKLDNKIDKVKKTVNELQGHERTSTAVIQRLTKSKGEIEIPGGTMAEIKTGIEALTMQVKEAQDNLKEFEIEQAKDAVKEDHKKELQDVLDKKMEENTVPFHPGSPDPFFDGGRSPNIIKNFGTEYVANDPENQRIVEFVTGKPGPFDYNPAESIQKIIDTLESSGCQICTAAMIAKQELKKFKG